MQMPKARITQMLNVSERPNHSKNLSTLTKRLMKSTEKNKNEFQHENHKEKNKVNKSIRFNSSL